MAFVLLVRSLIYWSPRSGAGVLYRKLLLYCLSMTRVKPPVAEHWDDGLAMQRTESQRTSRHGFVYTHSFASRGRSSWGQT